MTDLPGVTMSVPSRLGVDARFEDGELTLDLTPQPETLHHGIVRASVLSYAIDVVAGITVDQDPDVWTLTTDLSVRMRTLPAPEHILVANTILRAGRRSVTCKVELTIDDGTPIATGAVGFVRVPRRETDAPKPLVTPELAASFFRDLGTLSRPLREEAGSR